jgi:glutathione peroxidase
MKLLHLLAILLTSCFGANDNKSRPMDLTKDSSTRPSFYSYKAVTIEGDTIGFSKYKGKKVLIVNTASKCGYTPQYDELEKLHKQYGSKVVVLGFPCNQFGGQEPGNNKEIKEFCRLNYGVTFQMFDKVNVKGKDKHPLYDWLTDKEKNGWNSEAPGWNFCKYLINEKGELIKFFGSGVTPLSKEIVSAIEG